MPKTTVKKSQVEKIIRLTIEYYAAGPFSTPYISDAKRETETTYGIRWTHTDLIEDLAAYIAFEGGTYDQVYKALQVMGIEVEDDQPKEQEDK